MQANIYKHDGNRGSLVGTIKMQGGRLVPDSPIASEIAKESVYLGGDFIDARNPEAFLQVLPQLSSPYLYIELDNKRRYAKQEAETVGQSLLIICEDADLDDTAIENVVAAEDVAELGQTVAEKLSANLDTQPAFNSWGGDKSDKILNHIAKHHAAEPLNEGESFSQFSRRFLQELSRLVRHQENAEGSVVLVVSPLCRRLVRAWMASGMDMTGNLNMDVFAGNDPGGIIQLTFDGNEWLMQQYQPGEPDDDAGPDLNDPEIEQATRDYLSRIGAKMGWTQEDIDRQIDEIKGQNPEG